VREGLAGPGRGGAATPPPPRDHWLLFLLEGIALLILVALAIAAPPVASITATAFFGWLLLISGIAGLISTCAAHRAPGFGWSLASAIVGTAGIVLLVWPLSDALSLAAVLRTPSAARLR
jgi:uncharacterized membrane protein HdeD (DUF308 family)